jgi:hypothetical protein
MKRSLKINRESLVVGDLYYLHNSIKVRDGLLSDSFTVWSNDESIHITNSHNNRRVDTVWANEHNPFVFLETKEDKNIDSTYWYRILTKNGTIGWICLDDCDMQIFHIEFRKGILPSEG